jgi:hypothetical protein
MTMLRSQAVRPVLVTGVALIALVVAGCSPGALFGDDDADDAEQPSAETDTTTDTEPADDVDEDDLATDDGSEAA